LSGASASGEPEDNEAKWKMLRMRIKKLKSRITKIEQDFFQVKNGAGEDGAEAPMEKAKESLEEVGKEAAASKDGVDGAFEEKVDKIEAGLAKAAKSAKSNLPEAKHDEMLARIKAIEDKIESGTSKGEEPPETYTGNKKTGVNKPMKTEKKEESEADKTEDKAEEKPKANAAEVGAAAAADAEAAPKADVAEADSAEAPTKNDKLKALTARLAKLEAATNKKEESLFLEVQSSSRTSKMHRLRGGARKPFKHSPEFIELRDKVFDLESEFIMKLMPGHSVITSKDDPTGSADVEQTPEDAAKDQELLKRVKDLTGVLKSKLAQ
jgi:hypothetical protein